MNKDLKQRLLAEVVRLGDQILSLAEKDENGLSWKTMAVDYRQKPATVAWQKSESIYAGVSGIVLFLIQLYSVTKDEKYLEAAVEGMCWTAHFCKHKPAYSYSFFTGRLGVSYVMLQLFKLTRESAYLEKALSLAEGCTALLNGGAGVHDLLNGTAGVLLGLLHLHAATGSARVLKKVRLLTEYLLQSAHFGPVGLYWDRSPQNLRGLCGFSHGSAGIGFLFLELGHYLQNDSYYWIAQQAFLYESYYWDKEKENWPDFRKGIHKPEDFEKHKAAYFANDVAFFTEGRDMNAWCHGAVGIGLSRLRAAELLPSWRYELDIEAAVKKTWTTGITDKSRTPTLCHGSGGNAELFIESYTVFGSKTLLQHGEVTANRALDLKQQRGFYLSGYYEVFSEDISLFMGNAGVGYFYLRLLDSKTVPSILLPKIESPVGENSHLYLPQVHTTLSQIQKKILSISFARTLVVLDRFTPDVLVSFFNERQEESCVSLKESFTEFICILIPTLSQPVRAYVEDIFTLEKEKHQLDQTILDSAWFHIRERVMQEEAHRLVTQDEAAFSNVRLKLASEVKIVTTLWQWQQADWRIRLAALNSEPGTFSILLRPTVKEVVEIELSPLTRFVLAAFECANTVRCGIETVSKAFENTSSAPSQVIRRNILDQVKQLILSGILVEAKEEEG